MKEALELVSTFMRDFLGQPNNLIALLTVTLVGVTMVWIAVTGRLLQQSRNVLLADILARMVERLWNDSQVQLKEAFERSKDAAYYYRMSAAINRSFTLGLQNAFLKIDGKLARQLKETATVWEETAKSLLEEGARKTKRKTKK